MNIYKKLVDLATKLDENGLHKEAGSIDDIIKMSLEPRGGSHGQMQSLPPNWTQTGSGVEMGQPTMWPSSYSTPQGKLKPGRAKLQQTILQIREELGLGPGTFDKNLARALRTKYPQVWQKLRQSPKKYQASAILSEIKHNKEYDFAGKSPAGQEGMAFEVGPEQGQGFDFAGRMPPGQDTSGISFFEVGPDEKGVAKKTEQKPGQVKQQGTKALDALEKLAKLAEEMDKRGLFEEANKIDALIRSANTK